MIVLAIVMSKNERKPCSCSFSASSKRFSYMYIVHGIFALLPMHIWQLYFAIYHRSTFQWTYGYVRSCVLVYVFFAIISYVIFTRTCARPRERERIGVNMWRKRLNAVDHRSLLIVLPKRGPQCTVISIFDTQMISHLNRMYVHNAAATNLFPCGGIHNVKKIVWTEPSFFQKKNNKKLIKSCLYGVHRTSFSILKCEVNAQ